MNFKYITFIQKEVLIGSLLGDASLTISKRSLNPYLKIQRKLSDIKYLEWQYNIFNNFCNSGISKLSYLDKRTNKNYYSCCFLTKNIPEFLPIYNLWYQNKKKIVPKDIKLSPLTAAVWFADDGYIKRFGKSELRLSLATDGFNYSDVLFLANLLKITLNKKFNVCFKAISKHGQNQYVITGASDATYFFINYINSEYLKLNMDRKNVWSNINLDVTVKYKRSASYYKLANIILNMNEVSVKSIMPYNIYSTRSSISDALYNFYKLEYFTRLKFNKGYSYILTDLGKKYFEALQSEGIPNTLL